MEKSNNKVCVSIIVALYNTLKYLDSFFDCLFKQTFKDFEVIVMDDLSTDGSMNMLKSFQKIIVVKILNYFVAKRKCSPI